MGNKTRDVPRENTVSELICDIPGKRSYNIRGVTFTVHEKYKILKAIGVGAYGVVTSAIDTETDQKVALKKIAGVFEDLTDAKRVLREIRLMQALCHENVSISKRVTAQSKRDKTNLCIR